MKIEQPHFSPIIITLEYPKDVQELRDALQQYRNTSNLYGKNTPLVLEILRYLGGQA